MGVYNTPGYRVFGEQVSTGNIVRDVVPADQPLSLLFFLDLDPNVAAQPGVFWLNFRLIQGVNQFGYVWRGSLSQFPFRGAGRIWLSVGWNRATDATNGNTGIYNFKPTATFLIWAPGGFRVGLSQFAIAEDDHYLMIE